jgi:hypothetical protein
MVRAGVRACLNGRSWNHGSFSLDWVSNIIALGRCSAAAESAGVKEGIQVVLGIRYSQTL